MGRYTQSDPIGLIGGVNTYGYALNTPLSFFDLFGLDVCDEADLDGGWHFLDAIIGQNQRVTVRAGGRIKIVGGDDRYSLHLNMFYYKGTYTAIDESGEPLPGIYPIYEGALSTLLSGAHQQEVEYNIGGPSSKSFDWTFEILNFQTPCDNCGKPMIMVYEWR